MNMLGIFADEMHTIGVPYEFMSWTSAVEYPYFIGEYSETIQTTEDGYKESTLTVTGTTRGTWMELEEIKQKLENHFPPIFGLRKATDDGAVVFYYANAFPVPTGEADLKRIQINITVKEWRCAE